MKHALVVFESMFGNTGNVAEAVAEGLRTGMVVDLVEVGSAPPMLGDDVELLVVGGPTHAFSMSRPNTRADAAKQGADAGTADGIGLREWVDQVGKGAARPAVVAFDTKGPLVDGELDRARDWGARCAAEAG